MYTRDVLMWIQRNAYLLALVALLGVPAAELVCAAYCAPHQQHAQSVTAASHHGASQSSDHQGATVVRKARGEAAFGITHLSAPGCDTHGKSKDEQQATLTAVRSVTEKAASTVPALAPDGLSSTLTTIRHATFSYSPRRNISASRVPLVLRI